MNIEKAILIMRNELECVKSVDKCDRHCEDCPLAMEAEDIIECYEWVIKHLEWKVNTINVLCKAAEGYFLSEEENDIINNKLEEAVNGEEFR